MTFSTEKPKNDVKIITSILKDDFIQILVITAIGFCIRLNGLWAHGFRWDEIFLMLNAKRAFSSIDTISCPAILPYLVHFIFPIVKNDQYLRVIPLVAGTLLMPAAYSVMRRWQSHEAGLWSALIIAVSPIQVFYSQDLTVYSLLMLESLLALYFWDRLLEEGRGIDGVLYSVVMIAGCRTHVWFIFIFAAQLLWLFFFSRINKQFVAALSGTLAVAAVSALWLNDIPIQFKSYFFNWLSEPRFEDIARTFQVYLFGIAPPLGSWRALEGNRNIVYVAVSVLLLGAGTITAGGPKIRWLRALFVGLIGPISTALIFSYVITPVFHADSYAVVGFPAFLIIACNIFTARPPWLKRILQAVGAAYCVVCVALLLFYFNNFEKAPWRNLAGFIKTLPQPRVVDTSGLEHWNQLSLRYYLGVGEGWRGGKSKPTDDVPRIVYPIRLDKEEYFLKNLPEPWRVTRAHIASEYTAFVVEKAGDK